MTDSTDTHEVDLTHHVFDIHDAHEQRLRELEHASGLGGHHVPQT